jgi:hypothetical protein
MEKNMEKAQDGIANLIYDTLLKNHGFVVDNDKKDFIIKKTENHQVLVTFGKSLFFGIIVYAHNAFPDILIEKLIEIIQKFEKNKFLHDVISPDFSQEHLLIGGEINIEAIDDIHVVFENYIKLLAEAEKIGDMDHETFAVTRLDPKNTGLPFYIYTDSCNFFAGRNMSPRIKFIPAKNPDLTYYDAVSMSVSDNPEILDNNAEMGLSIAEIEQVKRFVKNNKDLLLRYSNDEIDVLDFFKAIKKVEGMKK